MARFLHVADVHLGMRITRFSDEAVKKVRQARFHALEKARDYCRRADNGVQFVVVAGDLFDDVHVTRDIARRAFELFDSFPVPVWVLPGNHDPLIPGSVWDLPPWKGSESGTLLQSLSAHSHGDGGSVVLPGTSAGTSLGTSPGTNHGTVSGTCRSTTSIVGRVTVLRERTPVEVEPGVWLLPCPVFRKTSTQDPTEWIRQFPRTKLPGIRIGIAHGCVMDRPHLPEDDHPISPTAPDDLELDYLALGHWHNAREFTDRQGHVRMVYPGVHEPMRFSGDQETTGWQPYSSSLGRDDFIDRGPGTAYVVTIGEPGTPPQVQRLTIGYHTWTHREVLVHGLEDVSRLIDEVSAAPGKEQMLLRLQLRGTLPLEAMSRLEDLRSVLASYVVGELVDKGLVLEPTAAELHNAVGSGVLQQVYAQLTTRTADADPQTALIAQRALRLMYRLLQEG